MKNKSPKFTNEEELKICSEYEQGESTIKLALKYKCASWGKIHSILKRHNKTCRDRSHQRRNYTIDEHFFDDINTEEKAYLLGILYADGGNVGHSVLLSLKSDDKLHLQTLNSTFQNKPIKTYSTKTTEYCRMEISNKHMVQRLVKCGIVPRKSLILTFPSENILPKCMIKHFIRGYYDGDGCLVINKNQIGGKGYFSIVSTFSFLTEIQSIIKENTGSNTQIVNINSLKNKNNKSTKRLVCCGNNQILKILKWLYTDATIYLNRKFNKYTELIEIQSKR